MFGSHVTPFDHPYYIESLFGDEESLLEIYSPTGGRITGIQHISSLPGEDTIEIEGFSENALTYER